MNMLSRQLAPAALAGAHAPRLQRKHAGAASSKNDQLCHQCDHKSLRTRLAVGSADDPLEHEAARIASQVMAHDTISTAPTSGRRDVDRAAAQSAPESVERTLASGGQSLAPALRQDMERRFGCSFFDVRVHTDERAQASARDIAAQAYTAGSHIVFAAGRYAPQSQDGQRLLAHELAHVLQQRDGVVRRAPAPNALDETAKAIIAAAKDANTTPDAAKRAVNAVTAIIETYYPADKAKVGKLEYKPKIDGLETSPIGTGPQLKGYIKIGHDFLENIDYFARRVLQVGHELQHIDQQRGGMGGQPKQHEREFLAFESEAMQEPKPGTGRLKPSTRIKLIDCALRNYYCLDAEAQKSYEEKKKKLLARREEFIGKVKEPTEAPTKCESCYSDRESKPGKPAGGAPGKTTVQPPPTKVSKNEVQPSNAPANKVKSSEANEKAKPKYSLAVGGEAEISGEGTEGKAEVSFELSIPLAKLIKPGGLHAGRLGGEPFKFVDEFTLKPGVDFKGGPAGLQTPLAIEAALKMVSIEWEIKKDTLSLELGVEAKATGEYTPQSGEGKVELGGAAGAELEYKPAENVFIKVEAKGEGKYSKTGDAVFQWNGVSFTAGAKVGLTFGGP